VSVLCPACGARIDEPSPLHGVDRLHGIPGEFEVALCRECGSGRTLPIVSAEELGSLYPDDYNAYALPTSPVLRALATLLFRARYGLALRVGALRALRSGPPGRLLDVGSGRGDLAIVLRDAGWDVRGLEPSGEACAEAESRGVRTVQGTLTDGSELDGPYDALVFNHSLEHVVEPLDDLRVARALLRDGGLVVVSTPNFGSWQRRRFDSAWFHLDLPRHRSHFTRRGLDLLLQRAGFGRIRTMTATSADGLPTSLEYRLFGRRRFQSGPGWYASVGLDVLAVPVTAAVNRLAGEGDILHATAVNEPSGG
jgi:SAM-dependent methyltransferase